MERKSGSHKGENGRIGVIGGCVDYSGAPALSGQAALRTGADLVKILTSESVKDIVAGFSENLIVRDYTGSYLDISGVEKCLKMVNWSDTTVLGPGLGNLNTKVVQEIVERSDKPLVIDADAIEPALEADISNAVFTPHQKEVELIENKFDSIEKFVRGRKSIVVLVKGATDKIYSSDGLEKISTGHPGMTVGGTGDVLTGIVAGLMAQGLSKKRAAIRAAEVNGLAGEKVAKEYGNGLVATDLLDEISKILFKD